MSARKGINRKKHRPVSRHNHLDFAQVIETVQLIQQLSRDAVEREHTKSQRACLHQSALNFAIGRRALREAATADRIDFVHEDHARLVILRITCRDKRARALSTVSTA